MLLESTNFTPLDLAASLGINHLASKYATLDNSFRLALYRNANGDVPAWSDLRFLGGTMAVLYSHFYAEDKSETVHRVCSDVATGLLSSFIATETCRTVAVKRMVENSNVSSLTSGSTSVFGEEFSEESSEDWSSDPHLEDIYGGDLDSDEEQVSYAYGW